MKRETKVKVYLQTIENQKAKIANIQEKKKKLFITYPKALYPDSVREPYLKSFEKKEKKISKIIELTRIKLRGVE
jgi:hypothetical protein